MKKMKLLPAPTVRPTAEQIAWQQMERIMFVHFGPKTWKFTKTEFPPVPLSEMNPVDLDVEQWCAAAKSFGARQIILVAKHEDGFCWWQTKTTDYSVASIPWRDGKADVVDELYQACQRNGLHFGIYIAPTDRSEGAAVGGRTVDPARQEAYTALYREQVKELCSKYDITEFWCDGGLTFSIADMIQKYAPNAVVFQGKEITTIRWCGNERGSVPYPSYDTLKDTFLKSGHATAVQSSPGGNAWAPLEADTTLYDHFWFWSKENENKRKSLDELMKVYYQSVGHGAVMLLNAAPTTKGNIPEADMKRYAELGAEIERRFGTELAGRKEIGTQFSTITFDALQEVNHIQIRENIAFGQRIRSFDLEVHTAEGWKTVYHGGPVGNHHIAVFETVQADAVRLNVLESAGIPVVMTFSAHHVTGVDIPALLQSLSEQTYFTNNFKQEFWTVTASELRKAEKDGGYRLDLSKQIVHASQYRISAECRNGFVKLQNPQLILDGVPQPEMLEQDELGLLISRTALPTEGSTSVLTVEILPDPALEDQAEIKWYIMEY